MDEAFRILDDGRVFFDYGPASMVVTARRGDEDLSDLAASAFPLLRDSLSEIAGALPVLRRFPDGMDYSDLTGLPRVMAESVLATGEPTLTPMAAVAGTVADAVADWLFARGADLVAVNNGGDVALRLGEGRSIRMGILPDLNGRVAQVVEIRAEDGIGGVCTSGLGGRSLTRGIAGGVTVFSRRCALADACATQTARTSSRRGCTPASPETSSRRATLHRSALSRRSIRFSRRRKGALSRRCVRRRSASGNAAISSAYMRISRASALPSGKARNNSATTSCKYCKRRIFPMKVGFIGLGRMGGHMCSNVIKAGFETYVSDLVPALVEQKVAEGAIGCKDNLEVAANMDIGFTMLPNGAIVEAVMCGPKGVLAHCKPGTIIVDMSSVAPGTTQKMAKVAAEHGVKYMDAPVSGGTIGAQKGTLTIMCGADEETFEKAKPVLEAIGKRIMRIGGTGMGDAMKIVNNMLLGANMASLAEALVLGAKLGLDNKTMYDVISTSSGNSYVVDAKMKKFIMPDKFEPGFAMDVQYKDLTLAQEAARGVKMPIPMSATCTAVYEQARAAGYGMEDMSAVIKLWEKLMGVEIRGELE